MFSKDLGTSKSLLLSVPFLLLSAMTIPVLPVWAQAPTTDSSSLTSDAIIQLEHEAQSGDPTAQLALGRVYEIGNGLARNDKQAMKWYRMSADQGNAAAQDRVGLMFASGRGVEKDKQEALRWFRNAAKQQNQKAMFDLGTVYYNGDGVGIDDVAAYAWFLLAQDSGSPDAIDAVNRMKQEKGRSEPEAFEKIGDMYQQGDDLPRNSSAAMKWYRKAAENGGPAMQVKLASLLLDSQSSASNYPEVYSPCAKAAEQHYAPAAACMGELYRDGSGVERNFSMAVKWFREAAGRGSSLAVLRLGQMYSKGEGLKQDKLSAYEFVYLASTSGLQEAVQEKDRLETGLTKKEINKAKAKAVQWTRENPPLALRRETLNP